MIDDRDTRTWSFVKRMKACNKDNAALQLLVLQLSFQLLRFGDLADGPVEVVLADRLPVILDRKQTTVSN